MVELDAIWDAGVWSFFRESLVVANDGPAG